MLADTQKHQNDSVWKTKLQTNTSIRMALEIYRTTNDADLQGILEAKTKKVPQPVSQLVYLKKFELYDRNFSSAKLIYVKLSI